MLVGYLLWRRLWRLDLFAAVTGAGSSLLNTAVKAAGAPPSTDGGSTSGPRSRGELPSGHAQAAVAGYGILLLVFLSVLRGLWRRAAIAVALMMVIGIGFSRVALRRTLSPMSLSGSSWAGLGLRRRPVSYRV